MHRAMTAAVVLQNSMTYIDENITVRKNVIIDPSIPHSYFVSYYEE